MKENKKSKSGGKKSIFSFIKTTKQAVILVVAIAVVCVVLFLVLKPGPSLRNGFRPTKGELISEVQSSIASLENTANLRTLQVSYEGVVPVENEKGKPGYNVLFKADLTSSFPFDQVRLEADDKAKEIIVYMPEVENKITIDDQSLEYQWFDEKMNNKDTLANALHYCREALEEELTDQDSIAGLARENAEKLIQGLTLPFLTDEYEEYSIVFKNLDSKTETTAEKDNSIEQDADEEDANEVTVEEETDENE